MTASCLKPSLNYSNVISRLREDKTLSAEKRDQNLIKPLIAAISVLFCIAIVPERATNLASICEKYNSFEACKVW